MRTVSLQPTPLACLSILSLSLILIGWSLINIQREEGGNQEILESRIQEWIQESELIWKKGISDREEAEKVSRIDPNKPYGIVDLRNIWDFFYPTYNCPHTVERLGRLGDGGKWVCGISHLAKSRHPCIVFSYGIAGDSSFEEEILNRTNCFVYAYDHTVEPAGVALTQLYPTRSKFAHLGLGRKDKSPLRTLKSEMKRHGKEFIDILKIDVEGAEYFILPQILKDFPHLPVGQLLIEIHLDFFPQKDLYRHFKKWWMLLEAAGLRAFRAEPNLVALLLEAEPRPNYYEISFLNVRTDHILLHA